jgi:hypothetical protein
MKRLLVSTVLSSSLVGLLIPAMAMAASRDTATTPRVVIGTICSYTAGSSVTIGQSCGSPSDVTVTLRTHTGLDYAGTTSPPPAPVNGDAAAAFVWYNKAGNPISWKLEYSETTFAYAKTLIPGTYVSGTGDCASGTLSIEGLGSKATEHTFITDSLTAYEDSGNANTCATVTSAYVPNEPIVVWADALTTGNWYARRVNANPAGSHRNPSSDQHVVFGIICSYTAGSSVTISQNCGSSSDVTVNLDQHTWFVYRGSTSPTPAPIVGDSAAAYLRWRNNFATVGEFAYSEDTFAFAQGLFAGTYVSSSGDCTTSSLTIQDLGSTNQTSFATDLNTIFENRGVASTCAAVTGAYVLGEPFVVSANEMTDASWYALRINAHPAISHRHPAKSLRVLFGTVCAYTPGVSVTISQNCGSPSDITVKLSGDANLVYEGSTSPAPAPVVGDSAAAFLRWHGAQPVASKLEYNETTFAFATSRFLGSYVSSTGTCSSGTVTIQDFGKSSAQTTFSADAYTVYLNKHKASTCATVSGTYASGEALRINANAVTNDTWYATQIDANTVHS